MTLAGISFTPHNGQFFKAALVRVSDGSVIATRQGTVSNDGLGTVNLAFTGLLISGTSYKVDYFAGQAGSQSCSQGHVYRSETVTVASGDLTLSADHNSPQNTALDACANL
jgi:hypothetical protein